MGGGGKAGLLEGCVYRSHYLSVKHQRVNVYFRLTVCKYKIPTPQVLRGGLLLLSRTRLLLTCGTPEHLWAAVNLDHF